MSQYRHLSRRNKNKNNQCPLEENNSVLNAFRSYARELDEKHDRYERILKLSRDITIESKRIIFLLHTIDARKQNHLKILAEADERLYKVIDVNFKAVAYELNGQDPYQYRGAYSPGLQEFIEAYSFIAYNKCWSDYEVQNGNAAMPCEHGLSDWIALQNRMEYELEEDKKPVKKDFEGDDENSELENFEELMQKPQTFVFFIDPTEYILGLSDLTGELMRRCINSLGSGETDACMPTCHVLQKFYSGYISLNVTRCRELSRKIYTMRQSVLKAENVCYNVRVRGVEAAKWGTICAESKLNENVDEGFY